MDPQTEAHFLRIWYTVMQIVFAITPPIYLLLIRFGTHISFRGYRVILPLLASFAAFCLFTEAYNLGRPIYVCFFPVRGETFSHPEETRLRIQWMLDLLAVALAAAAGVNGVVEEIVWGDPRPVGFKVEESRLDKKSDSRYGYGRMEGRTGTVRERLQRWWMGGRAGEALMMSAWAVGMCAYCIMLGRSKKGKFGSTVW